MRLASRQQGQKDSELISKHVHIYEWVCSPAFILVLHIINYSYDRSVKNTRTTHCIGRILSAVRVLW